MRVLVVDDHAPNRLLVSRLLAGWRCRSVEAVDATTALTLLHAAVAAGDPFRIALLGHAHA